MNNWFHRHKKNNFNKVSSVTFDLNDAYKISQPKDILSLSGDFSTFCQKHNLYSDAFRSSAYNNLIGPDGDDYDKLVGTMNIYVPNSDFTSYNKEAYEGAIKAWISDKAVEGYKITYRLDKSRMSGGPVYRVEIQENPTASYETIPSVNMANGNAFAILRLLQIPEEPSGQIDLQDLRQRIISISEEEMKSETMKPGYINPNVDFDLMRGEVPSGDTWKGEEPVVPEKPDSGVPIFTGGRDTQYIDNRLQDLYKLVDYGIRNGFKFITWG